MRIKKIASVLFALFIAAAPIQLAGCESAPEHSSVVLNGERHTAALKEFWGELYDTEPTPAEELSYRYSEERNGLVITDYLGSAEEVRIPDMIDGQTVAAVDLRYCYKSIKALILPDTIRFVDLAGYDEIDAYLSRKDETRYVHFSYYYVSELGGVVIDGYTGTGGEVRIPLKLPDPNDPNKKTYYDVKKVAFYDYDKKITRLIVPDEIKYVYAEPYEDVLIYESELNEQLARTKPKGQLYENIGVEKMNIPASLFHEEELAFSWSTLKSVYIPDNFTALTRGMFQESPLLNEVVYGADRLEIRDNAFYECGSLADFDLSRAAAIGSAAFGGCRSLSEVTFSPELTRIEAGAFSKCTGLTEITIPASVEHIGDFAFSGCKMLKAIEVEAGNRFYHSKDGILYDSGANKPVRFTEPNDV